MRIAFLPSSYLPDTVGGTEMYVHHLSQELARLGHHVAVVHHTATPRSSADGAYEVVPLPPCTPQRRADLYRFSRAGGAPGFDDFLDTWRPDVVHFHAFTLGAGLDHARAVRKRGTPYFVTYHTPAISCARGTLMHRGRSACDGRLDATRCAACVLEGRGWPAPLAALLARSPVGHERLPEGPWGPRFALPSLLDDSRESLLEFLGHADHVVACAAWCKEVLVRNGVPGEKVSVHRQGLAGPARSRRLRLPLSERRPLRLGFFGRFCWVKGPDILLDAARLLRQGGLEVRCELVGPIAAGDERWARRLLSRHADSAAYLGVKRGEDLAQWLGGLDLIVVPSRWLETGPLTLLEAWDQGVPVVGTDLGGIPDFFRPFALGCLTFEPESAEGLAAAVLRAVQWPKREEPQVEVPGMEELAGHMVGLYRAQEALHEHA